MKKIILLPLLTLFLLLGACVSEPEKTAAVTGPTVIKSKNDQRDYEYLVLPNQLRVLLVSDPEADKAAAAMSVQVGSASNPPGRDGLAHFLEHMLFMGTKKYPDVDDYSSFIKRNGGSDNAFTADNQTTYFFDIKAEALEPALDRFAQFFISPLFDAKYVEREANAVHSEYQLKLKDDNRRIDAAEKQSYNPASPYARFFVGSLDTLADRKDRKVRDDLLAFYKQHYSSNIMGLTVVGRQPLPVLRRWVEEKFSAIPDRHAKPYVPTENELLYQPQQLPVEVDVVPLKNQRKLTLAFPIPSQRKNYAAKPVDYIAHFIGDEGKGSLFDLLKQKGWITALSAGGQNLDDVQGVFNVNMDLTEEGAKHTQEITAYLFQYIDLLRNKGIEKWRFEELRRKGALDFRFEEKMSASTYAMLLSAKLLRYPPAEVLRGGKVMREWHPELLTGILDQLRPGNLVITRVEPGIGTDRTEPFYRVPYSIRKITGRQLAQLKEIGRDSPMELPQPNPFLPEKVELKKMAAPGPVPVPLENTPARTLWYQADSDFGVPRAVFALNLEIPGVRDTARKAVSQSLLADLVKDELNAWSYPAQLAGLSYSLSPTTDGIMLLVYGYDEKLPVLLKKVLAALKHPSLPGDRFRLYKAKLQRSLANQALERPYQQILGERSRRLLTPSWSPKQKLAALKDLSREDLEAYAGKLFNAAEVSALAYGNLDPEDARRLDQVLDQELLSGTHLQRVPEPRVSIIPKGETLRYRFDVDHPDSAVVINYQGNSKSIGEQARWRLLGHIMSSPFFNALRTEQQLGYVVAAAFSEVENMPGMILLVQSSAVSAEELQKRMETFVRDYEKTLAAMSDAEFQSHKAGLLAKLLKKDDMMLIRAMRYMDNLEREQYSFDFKEQVAEAVKGLSKSDLLAFYRENLLREPRRLIVYSPGTRFPAQ
ncbi:insulinase family protein [Thiolapillus brandeum]|uniref:Protease 3 n=1 Tax=Thiolapillus brandeum TaxID=1076588 RepID=A0A7U6GHM6_9GAMM|nr:insulinase family protein [Thiolapillus brandeum]BAO43781.1 peptidase M16 family protein [Thiolapillus brandeum]